MTPRSPSSSRQFRPVFRALAMLIGASWLLWHTRTTWAGALVVVTGLLAILSLGWPARYAPIGRLLDRLQNSTVQGFSWLVLGLVFLVVFVPVRAILDLRGRSRVRRRPKKDTYWAPVAGAPSPKSFERQF